MGVSATIAAVGALGSIYSANQQKKGAQAQADAATNAANQEAAQEQATAAQQQAQADAALKAQQQQAAAQLAQTTQASAQAAANAQAANLSPDNTPKVQLGTPQAITDGTKRKAAFQPQYASGITI